MPSSIGAMVAMLPSPDGEVLTEKREIGVVVKVWSFCSTGNAFSRFAARPSSAGLAAAAVSPGFRRPTTISCCPARDLATLRSDALGADQ